MATYIDRHIWGKWHQLRVVRRFLLVWWVILAIGLIGTLKQMSWLGAANLVKLPVAGGTYTEAALGQVKVLNPILPDDTTSADINRLIFSGLTRYNAHRQLEPDLATSWQVSADNRTYTFHLRKGVKWHDNVPFTSTDVAFTIAAIQNPDSRSPLATSWQGVTVQTPNDTTVVFTLPNALASFLDSTTIGIVPRHLLEQIDPSSLREADFNRHPVGTGPFQLKTFAPSASEIELAASPSYYLGKPKLDNFTFQFYDTPADALTAYAQHQVSSPGRITLDIAGDATKLAHLDRLNYSLPEETTLFFNTTDKTFSDATLRTTIARALDRKAVANAATAGTALAISQPILPGEDGYTTQYQASRFSISDAAAALSADGWAMKNGVRQKNGHQLAFTIVTADNTELKTAAGAVASQLNKLGMKVTVKSVALEDLQQSYLKPRNFQVLLFGINVGADPDVYAFWHSSQAKDPGINISAYNSKAADAALEAARIKTDPAVRAAKYNAFLKAWDADNPAVILYEPSYTYGTSDTAIGPAAHAIVTPDDRFYNVQNWTVRQRFGSTH
jgi:peptide/nickel transport system substrate-binding protein